MRNEFLTTGQRLRYLMEQKQIKNAPALAEAMYKEGLIQYSPKMTKKECHQSKGRTINIHLDLTSPESLSGDWVKRYCDFFHCSADYIFGYDSMPTPDISSVHDQTGLSESAIKKLQKMNERNRATGLSEALSHLIEDPDLEYLLTVMKLKRSGSFDTFTIGNAVFQPKEQAVIDYQTEMVFHDIMKRVRERRVSSPEAVRNLYNFAYSCYDEGKLTEDQLTDIIQHYDSGQFDYVPESINSDVSEKQ